MESISAWMPINTLHVTLLSKTYIGKLPRGPDYELVHIFLLRLDGIFQIRGVISPNLSAILSLEKALKKREEVFTLDIPIADCKLLHRTSVR